MKKILLAVLFFLLFFIYSQPAYASDNFATDYHVTYNVAVNADTNVVINVTLTNLTENYYASSYDIQVGFKDIRNLKASNENGLIDSMFETSDNGNKIHVNFNDKTLGINKKLNFNVSFQTKEVAQNLGNVWDINVPGISKESDFKTFDVTLNYPSFLNKPSYIKPAVISTDTNNLNHSISFTSKELGESGISLAFGDYQIYNFNLKYHLKNSNLFGVKTEIALPPTTNYQEIYIKNINPGPSNVYLDKDGNWLAEFRLNPSSEQEVTVNGTAKIYLAPKPESLSDKDKKMYLKPEAYWESQNPEIKEIASKLKTPKDIYNYVVNKLTYDFGRVESQSPRLGALGVLNKPSSAVCLEFTDLFITLARSVGIPARAINGYAYTNNSSQRPIGFAKDILHAWPEYYDTDKKTWIMVDPTWGNTTNGVDYFDVLDFDHFTFVINGLNSSYPIPAGGYKQQKDLNTKDVDITIGDKFPPSTVDLTPSVSMAENYLAGIPIKGSITIKNNGNTLSKSTNIYIDSGILTPLSQIINSESLPPFGKATYSFNFNKTDILTNEADTIRISVGENQIVRKIYISPFFLDKWFLFGGVLIVIFITASTISYIGLRRILISRREKQDNIYRQSQESTQKSS